MGAALAVLSSLALAGAAPGKCSGAGGGGPPRRAAAENLLLAPRPGAGWRDVLQVRLVHCTCVFSSFRLANSQQLLCQNVQMAGFQKLRLNAESRPPQKCRSVQAGADIFEVHAALQDQQWGVSAVAGRMDAACTLRMRCTNVRVYLIGCLLPNVTPPVNFDDKYRHSGLLHSVSLGWAIISTSASAHPVHRSGQVMVAHSQQVA